MRLRPAPAPSVSLVTRASLVAATALVTLTGCSSSPSRAASTDAATHLDAADAVDAASKQDSGRSKRDAAKGDDAGSPDATVDASPDSGTDAPPKERDAARDSHDARASGSDGDTSPDAGSGIAATMNDVSILFPLPSKASDLDLLLPASAPGAGGALFPSKLYAKVGPISGSHQPDGGRFAPGVAEYGDLHVVAMRLDPCFASLAPDPHGAGCSAQLRLILQAVSVSDHAGAAVDSALHAFYALTREQLLALARALVALRVANTPATGGPKLGPLAPHPLMVSQGLGGAYAEGVRQLIAQYAGPANLTRVAQMDFAEALPQWAFDAVTVTNASEGQVSPSPIPTVDGGASPSQSMFSGGGDPFGATITPGPTGAPSADDYLPLLAGAPASLSTSARKAALDALVRVENPADNSPNTIDCASCHMATPTETLVAKPLFAFDDTTSPLAFQPDGRSVVAADMTPTYAATGGLNVHAFSYVGSAPGINQRVVNETAAVVEYLNILPP